MAICCRCFRVAVFLGLAIFLGISQFSPAHAAGETIIPVVTDFALPDFLTLCAEPIPLENRHVREMLDREFTISVWDRAQVFMWIKRSGRYFPHIEEQLAKAGLPDDLKYLAVAESALIPYIRSSVGAIGLWQFMPQTGTRHGLNKGYGIDERRNHELSTDAAILYLKKLYQQFGKWSLALAAYNCGENCVQNAIKEQNVPDYFRLNLPLETERFVFRIAAIKIILENPARYGYHVPSGHLYQPIPGDVRTVKVPYSVSIIDLAKVLGTDYKILKELNPHIIGKYLPRGQYSLKVPPGKGEALSASLKKLSIKKKTRSYEAGYYVVKEGIPFRVFREKQEFQSVT